MKTRAQIKGTFLSASLALSMIVSAQAAETASVQTSVSQASSSTFFSKEKWGVSYLNYMNGPTFRESTGGSINHFLTLKHKFSPDWALSGVLRPDSNFGNESAFGTMGDPYMRLEYPSIYKGENGLKVTGDVRYSAPVSESSRQSKILGIVSPCVKTALDVDRVSLLYVFIPKVYLNTLNQDGQRTASHGHYVSASYMLFPKVTLDFALYPVWTVSRNRGVAFNDLPAYPGFTVNFSETFSVSPYVEIPLMKTEGKTVSLGGMLSYALL